MITSTMAIISSKLFAYLVIVFSLTIYPILIECKEILMVVEVDDVYFMNTSELIRYHGKAVEVHEIEKDKYSLQLHRITVENGRDKKKIPVLFYHGFYFSSSIFVVNEPNRTLAFILSKNGYDVWLGNMRGTKYSRFSSTSDDGDRERFWQHGMDEIISEDMPTVIDYILKETKSTQLYYYGHSTGASLLFGLLASNPKYNDKIKAFMALSPAIFMTGADCVLEKDAKEALQEEFKEGENTGFGVTAAQLFVSLIAHTGIDMLIEYSGDATGLEPGLLNYTMLGLYAMQLADSLSQRHYRHFGQIINSDKFAKFDWGSKSLNMQHYQMNSPPVYDLSKVTAPTYIFVPFHDILATPDGAWKLANSIANCKQYIKVGNENNGHFYLVGGTDVEIHEAIIKNMESA